jgi:soluble epoxide hydrolase / lipid-phosphate phosphatase
MGYGKSVVSRILPVIREELNKIIHLGRTDAPAHTLSDYGCRRIADDMAELCRQLDLSSVLLGGHDWGGFVVYRIALYYPKLVTALFSVCTPYSPPNLKYEPLGIFVAKLVPNFQYQCHFASGEVEEKIQSRQEIRNFLNG